MTTVRVKLFATLVDYRPGLKAGQVATIDLPDGAAVADLIRALGVPEPQVKLVFVNGIIRGRDHALGEGDEVGIFPPVGGG